jgi:hypothetical protein
LTSALAETHRSRCTTVEDAIAVSQSRLLLLDVDGVLSPTGVAVPPRFAQRSTTAYSVVIRREHRGWPDELAGGFDLAWTTTWLTQPTASTGSFWICRGYRSYRSAG